MKKMLPFLALIALISAIFLREKLFTKPVPTEVPVEKTIEQPRSAPISNPQPIPTHAPTASTPLDSLTCEQRQYPNMDCQDEALLHEAKIEILRAKDLFQDLCNKGKGEGCYRMGLIHRDRGDTEKMIAFYAKGCALAHSMACFNQDFLSKATVQLKQFLNKKIDCSRSDLKTCHNIGILHRELAQLAPAIQNLVPPCQGGMAESCLALAEIARASESPAEAKLRYQKACDLKLKEACDALKLL